MAELKPCPYCGGPAEIFTGRSLPLRGKRLCASQIEALEKVAEYKQSGVVLRYRISQHEYRRVDMKQSKMKYAVTVEMQAFIPRCCNRECAGRNQIMFQTEEGAIEAWNGRVEDGK